MHYNNKSQSICLFSRLNEGSELDLLNIKNMALIFNNYGLYRRKFKKINEKKVNIDEVKR